LIWAFGVFVAWISSYMSSSEIRRVSKAIEIQRELKVRMDTLDGNGGMARQTNNNVRRASLEVEEPSGGSADERTIYQSDNLSSASNAAIAAIAIQQSGGVSHQEESLELTAAHAAGFLVMASTSLLILFFFKIYNVVKIMYAFGCSGAFAQMIVHPGFIALCRKLRWDGPLKPLSWFSEAAVTRETLRGGMKGHCMSCLFSVFGPTSMVDLASVVLSYGVGAIWLWVAFTIPHPDTVVFYWVVQNVFGTCMCMLFLETIKLNAIKVGAILLIVAFFYDIFFVFITPLLTKHGESIMVRSRILHRLPFVASPFSVLCLAVINRSMLPLAEAHQRRILLGARSTLSRLIVRVVILFLCCLPSLELATIKVGVPCWA